MINGRVDSFSSYNNFSQDTRFHCGCSRLEEETRPSSSKRGGRRLREIGPTHCKREKRKEKATHSSRRARLVLILLLLLLDNYSHISLSSSLLFTLVLYGALPLPLRPSKYNACHVCRLMFFSLFMYIHSSFFFFDFHNHRFMAILIVSLFPSPLST